MRKILFFSTNGSPSPGLLAAFRSAEMTLHEVRSAANAEKELNTDGYLAILHRCEKVSGAQEKFCAAAKSIRPQIPLICALKRGTVDDAVRLMKAGADDVIVIPELDEELIDAVRNNVARSSKGGSGADRHRDVKTELIGISPMMEEVRSAIDLVANSSTPVLITGESGTGKEIVARMIHEKSSRSKEPFIALNCAALPKDIIENELFGHEAGAFTGALKQKSGNFEAADRGTLFFDEIGEMNPDTQAKLLRVLEQKAFRRLGGEEEIRVDVRTVAATNKRIQEAITSGEFRQDLYYRFSVIEIHMPSLRDRREDIPLLIDHFLSSFMQMYNRPQRSFTKEAMALLTQYDWPGNVRELRNAVERGVVVSTDHRITPADLPESIQKKASSLSASVLIPVGTTCEEAEQQLIKRTLAHTNNNKSKAAKMLGMSRKTLHLKLHKFNAS